MSGPRVATPWAPNSRAYCLPGSLVVKLALGEAPESIPVWADVRRGAFAAASSVDGGAIDRIVRRRAGVVRIARVHAAASSRPGARHCGYDTREHVFGLARTFRVDVPRGTPIEPLVDSLNQLATVDGAIPNYACVTPFEEAALASPVDDTSWDAVRAQEALAYEPGDPSVIVAIVDSGVAPSHPELDGRLRPGLDTVQLGQSDLALGLELLGDRSQIDTDPTDTVVGHGMACAGIVGALGLKMSPGLAGNTQILPLRGLGAARFPGTPQAVGIGAVTDLDAAMKAAVDLGAKVINMSFGTDDETLSPNLPRPHADVVAYALDRGCVLVAASGNSGRPGVYWPAAYPGVIAVAAADGALRPCAFSTVGDHVALCAPGARVLTLGLEGYQRATGTSFAAPFVAATAALLVARARRRSAPLDGAQVCRLLTDSAQPFAGASAYPGCGAGVLDAAAALRTLDAQLDAALPDAPGVDRASAFGLQARTVHVEGKERSS
jgi:subtilisin family serine protease